MVFHDGRHKEYHLRPKMHYCLMVLFALKIFFPPISKMMPSNFFKFFIHHLLENYTGNNLNK